MGKGSLVPTAKKAINIGRVMMTKQTNSTHWKGLWKTKDKEIRI
jgi:hypothetical protein